MSAARIAELEAQVDALFRAVLAADCSARYSRGVQMYAIPAARWDAIRRAAGIPFDSRRFSAPSTISSATEPDASVSAGEG